MISRPNDSAPNDFGSRDHEAQLHAEGHYAHLEELTPIELLRWTYARVARGPDDPGFG